MDEQLAPFFDFAAAQLITDSLSPHLFLDFQKANVYDTAWAFRLFLQTIVPPGDPLEAMLGSVSSIIRFSGKPVDAGNFAQYAQPKHLNTDRVKYLIAVNDHQAGYCRQLLKHLPDKERGIKTDIPRIQNLYKPATKD